MVLPTHEGMRNRASVAGVREARDEPHPEPHGSGLRIVGHEAAVEMLNIAAISQKLVVEWVRYAEVQDDRVLRKILHDLAAVWLRLASNPERAIRTVLHALSVFHEVAVLSGFLLNHPKALVRAGQHPNSDAPLNQGERERPTDLRSGADDEYRLLEFDHSDDLERLLQYHCGSHRVAMNHRNLELVSKLTHDQGSTLGHRFPFDQSAETNDGHSARLSVEDGFQNARNDFLVLAHEVMSEVANDHRLTVHAGESETIDDIVRPATHPIQVAHDKAERPDRKPENGEVRVVVQVFEIPEKPIPRLHPVDDESELLGVLIRFDGHFLFLSAFFGRGRVVNLCAKNA